MQVCGWVGVSGLCAPKNIQPQEPAMLRHMATVRACVLRMEGSPSLCRVSAHTAGIMFVRECGGGAGMYDSSQRAVGILRLEPEVLTLALFPEKSKSFSLDFLTCPRGDH